MPQNVPSGSTTWNGGLTNIKIKFTVNQVRLP